MALAMGPYVNAGAKQQQAFKFGGTVYQGISYVHDRLLIK